VEATAAIVGLAGVALGTLLTALLTRRNQRQSKLDELLAQAVNDAIDAIAQVASGHQGAQTRYASAVSRIALHGSAQVVATWRLFQNEATSESLDGRRRLVTAVQAVRQQLGNGHATTDDMHVLMFGPGPPGERPKRSTRLPGA
jgi:hypothetical protein